MRIYTTFMSLLEVVGLLLCLLYYDKSDRGKWKEEDFKFEKQWFIWQIVIDFIFVASAIVTWVYISNSNNLIEMLEYYRKKSSMIGKSLNYIAVQGIFSLYVVVIGIGGIKHNIPKFSKFMLLIHMLAILTYSLTPLVLNIAN